MGEREEQRERRERGTEIERGGQRETKRERGYRE